MNRHVDPFSPWILLVDNLPLDRRTWAAEIRARIPAAQLVQASDASQALVAMAQRRFDLIITDLQMRQGGNLTLYEGLEVIQTAGEVEPRVPVLVVSEVDTDETYIKIYKFANLHGFIPKQDIETGAEVADGAVRIFRGEKVFSPVALRRFATIVAGDDADGMDRRFADGHAPALTERETQVFDLIGRHGWNNREIADNLGIKERYAEKLVGHVLHKYGFKSREQAMWEWRRQHP
jgi:DNA-binding NarL/FixJ family response regulator